MSSPKHIIFLLCGLPKYLGNGFSSGRPVLSFLTHHSCSETAKFLHVEKFTVLGLGNSVCVLPSQEPRLCPPEKYRILYMSWSSSLRQVQGALKAMGVASVSSCEMESTSVIKRTLKPVLIGRSGEEATCAGLGDPESWNIKHWGG